VAKRGALPIRVGAGVFQCAVFQEARAEGGRLASRHQMVRRGWRPDHIIDSTGASMLQALGVTFARAGSASASPTPAPRCGLLERRETSAEAGYPLS
jgi:hypothetical protein